VESNFLILNLLYYIMLSFSINLNRISFVLSVHVNMTFFINAPVRRRSMRSCFVFFEEEDRVMLIQSSTEVNKIDYKLFLL
jgi:hypothetical protein